jgi:hypothetical protein
MAKYATFAKRLTLVAALAMLAASSSGCTLTWGFLKDTYAFMLFWETLPPVPVSAYWSQKVEDAYHEAEYYKKVPILDPVEGEHAPLFCIDPPSPDEVMRALPDDTSGGFAFLAETARNNVQIVTELIVDRTDECRFFPLVGPAKLKHCHYMCTVYYTKIIRSDWPVPFSHTDNVKDIVYVDHDHLIRCAGPMTPQ